MNRDFILSLKELRIAFRTFNGGVNAVNGVDLDIAPGETVGLVGESGCGKSVTAMSILGLLPKRSTEVRGKIIFRKKNLLESSKKEILEIRGNSISMIFQEPMTSLNPVMTIGDQIAEALVLHQDLDWGPARQKAVEMLDQVQIPSPDIRAKNYPHSMSGGMRQRAMIAMALSCQPELLLADEPTTALDVTIQAQTLDLMQRLKAKLNTAILLITHDLGVIAEMAQRVLVMYAGRVVEEAAVNDLFKDPLHPYTKGLLGSIPVLGEKFNTGRKKLIEVPGIVPSLFDMPTGCAFHPRCSQTMDICRKKEPPHANLGPARKVSCWLTTEGVQ